MVLRKDSWTSIQIYLVKSSGIYRKLVKIKILLSSFAILGNDAISGLSECSPRSLACSEAWARHAVEMMVTVLYDSEKMNRTKCWAIFFII
jgi:hypothetical protein